MICFLCNSLSGIITTPNLPHMKKVFLAVPILLLVSFSLSESGLTKKEKKAAISYLEETRTDLKNTIAGLSEEQFNFKPGADRWSVKECLQHIASTEIALWQLCEGTLKAPANPEKRSEIKMSDEQLIKTFTDRSNKVKTSESLQPDKSPFLTALDAVSSIESSREKLIKYMKGTKDDMRNHVTQLPFGWIDAYQLVLFIGAHCNRHTQQIAEVMADPNFPKK
jgi:uncharacterized damage-inducible protein DinB